MRNERKLALVRQARRLSHRLPPQWDRRVREAGKVVLDYRGARRCALRAALFARLGRHDPFVLAPFGPGRLVVDARDGEIGRVVFITGGYERIYMETALEVLRSTTGFSAEGTTFVDVGANIGTSTVDALLAFGFGRAECFEPAPDNLRLLRVNLILNGLEPVATVHPVALSDRDGEATLEISATNSGDHRIGASATGAPVVCRTLDSLVAEGALSLDDLGLVWMDVQGHEPFVLEGAGSVLERATPWVIEYTPRALAESGTLDRLDDLVRTRFRQVVDLRLLASGVPSAAFHPACDLGAVRAGLEADEHTDLLLLR